MLSSQQHHTSMGRGALLGATAHSKYTDTLSNAIYQMYSLWANPERDRDLKWRPLNFWGRSVHPLRATAAAEQLTLPRVVLSHLHLLHTFCWEPAGPSFHSSFPKATFTNAQHCGEKSREVMRTRRVPKTGRAE